MSARPNIFIVVKECSAGNESVGSEWLETCTFSPATTLADVWAWHERIAGHHMKGRVILTLENKADDQQPF